MSMRDFECMTPEEFRAVVISRVKNDEIEEKREWERLRTAVTILLQPHSKKRLEARDVIKFPWENVKSKSTEKKGERSSVSRFKELTKRIG